MAGATPSIDVIKQAIIKINRRHGLETRFLDPNNEEDRKLIEKARAEQAEKEKAEKAKKARKEEE